MAGLKKIKICYSSSEARQDHNYTFMEELKLLNNLTREVNITTLCPRKVSKMAVFMQKNEGKLKNTNRHLFFSNIAANFRWRYEEKLVS